MYTVLGQHDADGLAAPGAVSSSLTSQAQFSPALRRGSQSVELPLNPESDPEESHLVTSDAGLSFRPVASRLIFFGNNFFCCSKLVANT